VTITVTPVNDAPVAGNNSYTVNEDTPLSVAAPGVLGNDSDPDGDPLTAVLATGPANGTLTLNANGSFAYTPRTNFNGTDSFTYQAQDPSAAPSSPATVTITVTPVNDAPVANNDSYTMRALDILLVVPGPGVLGNDTDPDGDPLTAELVTASSNGILILNADGSFTYTPLASLVSFMDSFTYRARDAAANSNVATVTIRVNVP
jgi:VCBS repeat-containing protein